MELDYKEVVDGIIKKYDGKKDAIIAILQDVQSQFRWLSSDVLSFISRRLKIPISSLYSIATFYKSFYLKPRGEKVVKVCMGTACHVRGAGKIVDTLSEELKIKPGETTPDGEYTLETVNCVGCCAIGPIVILNDEYYGNVSSQSVQKLLQREKANE